MLQIRNRTTTLLLLSLLAFSSAANAQSTNRTESPDLEFPPLTVQTIEVTPLDVLQQQSQLMRKELLSTYRGSDLFGQMIMANSKIQGSARRFLSQPNPSNSVEEVALMEGFVLELEGFIEEANHRSSITPNAEVANHLGQMVAAIEDLKQKQSFASSSNTLASSSDTLAFDSRLSSEPQQQTAPFGPELPPWNLDDTDPGSITSNLPIAPADMDHYPTLPAPGSQFELLELDPPQQSFSDQPISPGLPQSVLKPTPELESFDLPNTGGSVIVQSPVPQPRFQAPIPQPQFRAPVPQYRAPVSQGFSAQVFLYKKPAYRPKPYVKSYVPRSRSSYYRAPYSGGRSCPYSRR